MDPRTQQQDNFSLGQEFDGNPFQGIIGGGQQQAAPMTPPQTGGEEAGNPAMDPTMVHRMQEMQDPKKNQLLPGANPGGSKYLIGAIQQIQGFIAESTERDEIAIGRSIIQLLTRLVVKDQEKLAEKLAGDNKAAQQPTTPQMPGGQPQGY